MKRIYIVILSLFFTLCGFAQQLEIASPLMHEASVGAANVPTDNNGNPCAKIIVDLPLEDAVIEGLYIVGNVKEKAGRYELFVSVPKKKGQKISVRHTNFGALDIDLWTRDGALVGREAYRVKLKPIQDDKFIVDMHGNRIDVEDKKVEVIVHEDAGGQYLVMTVMPKDASVQIDGQFVSAKDGTLSKLLTYGRHTYRAEHPMYESKSGTIDIGKDKVTMNVELTPIFGYLSISSTPEAGADVYVDGERVGSTPFTTKALKEGTHNVRVMRDMYESEEKVVTVERNQTLPIAFSLKPTFGNVTIACADTCAEILLDGKKLGTGTWRGRIDRGKHKVDALRANHRTASKTIDVAADAQAKFDIDAPQPIVGSLNITSDPIGATIRIDGKDVGETPSIISNLLIGSHRVSVSKSGCSDFENTITIEEGKITPLEVILETGKQITIATDKSGDDIYVDGKLTGTSPLTTSLSFGNHTAYAMRGGDKSSVETINVTASMNSSQISLNFGLTRFTVNGVSFEMVKVDGGTFNMGSNDSDAYDWEKPVHSVTVSSFFIGKTEVTQALWKAVMGNNPSRFQGDDLPVERVSWDDCQEFIRKLNSATGKTFRLPTEAEWEFAARGGNSSRGYKYSGSNTIDNVAWYWNNPSKMTHAVGTKQANELGLYDMSGNVEEWCSDWYGDYSSSSQTNPKGPSSGSSRVRRGGSWACKAGGCRVSIRYHLSPDSRIRYLGLRLVLVP